ncbi:MAG: hypothetical protein HFJ75_03355 [Eggerthellaceae bacterium]|nr:hypothetical protein [Eggerthellaceae bacterium]
MGLDDELEIMEETGETDAEQIDEETEIQDVEDDVDEILDADAEESDLEHAYASFETDNETDYDGWSDDEVTEAEADDEAARALNNEGYEIEDGNDLEAEVIEMEIEDGDVYAYIVDEDDNEIGFILLDEDGNEQEYYFVEDDDEQDEDGDDGVTVIRASDEEEFDLGITREGVAEATADMNAIYKDGVAVAAELKGAFDDISDSLSFLKKK